MFEIREEDLPVVVTRQALLVIDVQCDLVSPSPALPVEYPTEFAEKLVRLPHLFRPAGKVIWVRSQFGEHRPVNDGSRDAEEVITNEQLPAEQNDDTETIKKSQAELTAGRRALVSNGSTEGSVKKEDAVPPDNEEDLVELHETFLTRSKDAEPSIMLVTTVGSNYSPVTIRAMDAAQDIYFTKTHYSAFKSGYLLLALRAQFVTELFFVGALTNISIYATAMDAAKYGYRITLIEDCIGYRSKARHDEAVKRLVEATGCEVITSLEFMARKQAENTTRLARANAKRNERPGRDGRSLSQYMDALKLSNASQTASSKETLAPASSVSKRGDLAEAAQTREKSSSRSTDNAGSLSTQERRTRADLGKDKPIHNPSVHVFTANHAKAERPQSPGNHPDRVTRPASKPKTRRRLSRSAPESEASYNDAVTATTLVLPQPPPNPKSSQTHNADLSGRIAGTVALTPGTRVEVTSAGPLLEADDDEDEDNDDDEEDAAELMARARAQMAAIRANRRVTTKARDVKPSSAVELPDMSSLKLDGAICEGDTSVIENLLPRPGDVFERVRDEVRWQTMFHQGGAVPRLVAVQGEISKDGVIPVYRHPADESPPLLGFSPAVLQIKAEVERKLGHEVNHCLIQFYRDGKDYISEHSDKTLDIAPDSYIANVSLGATRTMVFRTKKSSNSKEISESTPSSRTTCKAVLPHNSLCKVGLKTNMKWLHGIRQDKRAEKEKSASELAYDGGRISLTFRLIKTFLNANHTEIWGQGARCKERGGAGRIVNGMTPEAELMLQAFGKENHSSDFNWKAAYGSGFDVLHLSNDKKLFLSGDPVADLRVKFILDQHHVSWRTGQLSPAFNWKSGNPDDDSESDVPHRFIVKLVDNDEPRTPIEGDLSIICFLELFYGPLATADSPSRARMASRLSRMHQSDELLRLWRTDKFQVKPFRSMLAVWDSYLTVDKFMAAPYLTVADYAFWPVLHEIVLSWGVDGLGFDRLQAYYERIRKLACIEALLSSSSEAASTKSGHTTTNGPPNGRVIDGNIDLSKEEDSRGTKQDN